MLRPCFHGVTTVAELKLKDTVPGMSKDTCFHGVTTVAELKPGSSAITAARPCSFPRRHNRGRIEAGSCRPSNRSHPGFHGVTTVAELKPRTAAVEAFAHDPFPRRHNRGRIEARFPIPNRLRPLAFPRRHNRGRIEACSGPAETGNPDSGFHGVTTVAELKPEPAFP